MAKPETLENLQLMWEQICRMQNLLDGLLEYSKIRLLVGAVEDVDVAELVNSIAVMQAPPPDFVVNFEGETRIIRTERIALQMVLANLISNVVKHHDRTAGRVVVTARPVGGFVEFRVSDDGPGIPSEFHHRIFTIFQTLKRRDDSEVNGIVLAIAKRKVEADGGRIWVQSAPPVRGTTFAFT